MSDGTKLAVAILVMWIALVFFFFAFHPGGVKNVSNPLEMLKWLVDEFTKLTGGSTATASLTADITGANTSALSYPGFTNTAEGGSDIGSANQGGVQLA
jgi:hypothetical protein